MFPVMYVLTTRKSQDLYQEVFAAMKRLVLEFSPTHIMADFQETCVSAFKQLVGNTVPLFTKRVQKVGLKESYHNETDKVNEVPGIPYLNIISTLGETGVD